MNVDRQRLGIVLIDHGSKIEASNQLLLAVAESLRAASDYGIVEVAHMELAQPDLETAFGRCVEQGAEGIVVQPYFLGPGRHVRSDIPRLAAAASAVHSGIEFVVSRPIGLHPAMSAILRDRIDEALG